MFRVAVRIIMLYTDTCIIDVILQHCMLVFIFNLLCLIAHVVMTYGRQIVHMCVCVSVILISQTPLKPNMSAVKAQHDKISME